jgi:energy-coupling factor transport system ATP-binding protein
LKVRVENLTVVINDKPVLNNINVEFGKGVHVVLGPNGAGKSTLLKSIACIIRPNKGRVLIDEKELCNRPRREIAKLVGYSWQNPLYGFFESTVRREIYFIIKNLKVKPREDIIKILEVDKLLDRSPFELSGGEAKRVSLASILIADQPIILLDEPFEELDWKGIISLSKLINIFRNEGKIIVIATNNPLLLESLRPDTYVILRSGSIRSSGSWSDLNDNILKENNIIPREYVCRLCPR